jgi:hypothetical protein
MREKKVSATLVTSQTSEFSSPERVLGLEKITFQVTLISLYQVISHEGTRYAVTRRCTCRGSNLMMKSRILSS